MLLEEIEIGGRYKFSGPNNGSTWWIVQKIYRPEDKDPYVEIVKEDELIEVRKKRWTAIYHRRWVDPANLHLEVKSKRKRGKKQLVISEVEEVVMTFDNGVRLCVENVSFWPNHKRRGRKPKNADD